MNRRALHELQAAALNGLHVLAFAGALGVLGPALDDDTPRARPATTASAQALPHPTSEPTP